MAAGLRILIVFLLVTVWFGVDPGESTAQQVVTYHPPQATVGYVPVQYGLLGRRVALKPVVGVTPAATTTYSLSPPVVQFGQPLPAARSTLASPAAVVTTYYPPAPAVYVAPVRTIHVAPAVYLAPPPLTTTTYYVSPW